MFILSFTCSNMVDKPGNTPCLTSRRCSSSLLQLFHLGYIIAHCFLLRFPFNSLPCIPLVFFLHVEHSRTACIHRSNSSLLEQSIENELVVICCGLWKGLSFLSILLEFLLQTHFFSPSRCTRNVITSLPQPIVAVPSFICADAFNKFLPFCTGFAAGCMIWMVVAEVLPDAFKEALPTPVASAATLSVAFMEALSFLFQNFSHDYNSEDASGFFVSLLFGLGPLLGGLVLVAFALAFRLQHALLMGAASGIAIILGAWRPLQLLVSSKIGFFPLILLLTVGAAFVHVSSSTILKVVCNKRASSNNLPTITRFPVSVLTLQSFLACGAVAFHSLAEGLALGVAAPKAYGLGRHMVLPVSLHGLPRGAAVASCIFGATDSWHGSLAAAAVIGFVGPISAIGAILAGIDYSGLDHVMVLACGGLVPCFVKIVERAVRLDMRKSSCGLAVGVGFATLCLTCTKLVCLHTPYCNSAPEAVR